MTNQHAQPKPNEMCWCGSGRKYKQCHRAIDTALPENKYSESQRVYSKNWRITADMQYARGDYHWMACQLKPFQISRILDVGCGSGHGIRAMLDVFGYKTTLVGIDENPSCLVETRETLQRAGMGTHDVFLRVKTVASRGKFRSIATAMPATHTQPILLVEGDVCSDEILKDSLIASGPFDAVTIWLSGVHMLRQDNEFVRQAGVNSDQHHRLLVQNAVYELADKVLRVGGVLQVVDRGEEPSSPLLKADIIRSHEDQAAPTSLYVSSLTHAPWTPLRQNRVPMVSTPGSSGRIPGTNLALISVISVKR